MTTTEQAEARAMLPEFPDPWALYVGRKEDSDGNWHPIVELFGEPYGVKMRLFTADQMRAYAQAAIAAAPRGGR